MRFGKKQTAESAITDVKPETEETIVSGGVAGDSGDATQKAAEDATAAQNATAAASAPNEGEDAPVTAADLAPIEDTSGEEYLVDAIEEYLAEAKVRFESILTGMANSTAEAIKHLEQAAHYLKDHIADHGTEEEAA